ncbi:ester cyclase [Streptomyces sp. NBC_00009]|uniref:ester cyclase n=1 Tax=Streptomyces sp. NBC_00009 TaxID=2975620 RepID=UPI003868EDF0
MTQLHQEARGGAVLDEGPQRPGLLLIDCKTARVSDMNRLMDSWVEQTKGRRTATHSIVGKDRSEPDHYVEIVEYPSYEEAIRNLQLPETSRLFHEIVALCDEKPALVGLDVVRDQQYNKAIIHQYFNEVLNGRNLDLIDGLFLPDYQDHDPANKVDAYGPAGVRDKVAGYLSAFDLQFRDLEQTAEGDDVTTRWTCHGTHTGEYMGFPATKKEVEVTGIAIHRIREGKIAEGWWNWDVLGMLQQLGIVEAAV